MVGLSQVSARYWIQQSPHVSRAEAIELLSTLMWRGISRFPRQGHGQPANASQSPAAQGE
ncbi:MAG TPA: TetR/AcrR family transcriptional regulator, partial [Nakamurella sp.]|jgi:hypothetical protein